MSALIVIALLAGAALTLTALAGTATATRQLLRELARQFKPTTPTPNPSHTPDPRRRTAKERT